MADLLHKIRASIGRRGLVGTLRHSVQRLQTMWERLTPQYRRLVNSKAVEDAEYDRSHGVDTAGILASPHLQIASGNRDESAGYWAISEREFRLVFGALAIPHEQYTFIDFGSGKGRALLLASEYPFRRVIGVEFARDLHEISERNIRAFRSDRQRCRDVASICADVLDFELPCDALVCFFYNPFNAQVMEPVIEKMRRSHEEHPRDIIVVYANAKEASLWEKAGFVAKIKQIDVHAIYRTRPSASSATNPDI